MDPDLANWLNHRRWVSSEEDADADAPPRADCSLPPPKPGGCRDRAKLLCEFRELTSKQLNCLADLFKSFDRNNDGCIDIEDLKKIMEKLDAPQTHVKLKEMIREFDGDGDGQITLREFLLMHRKSTEASNVDSGLAAFANLDSVDVGAEGVRTAKSFFEAKMEKIAEKNKFLDEVNMQKEQRKREGIEKQRRQEAFKSRRAVFDPSTEMLPV
uniref:EF-hand domain-containing protein n=1 Tax=Trichuris muris TaxID=70415 RepID=A0A5S6QDQ1_TRIMR